MIWVDREVKKLRERKLPLEWVDDMKTPSGRVHVGALRGIIIHDLVYKVLLENGIKAKFTYVFNDMDPMDAIPSYLEFSKWQKYEGVPLHKIPSPGEGYKSFAEYYALEFVKTFEKLNCHPEILWSSKLYESGKMNDVIKEILDQSDKVREIYSKVAKAHKAKDWYPFQVICENCGKVGTTHVNNWDGKHVYYTCQPHMVTWAKGCGHKGKITPFDGHGKLTWRVDWPAHWKVIGVTVEGSGKDHMSSGGSYDMASAICKEVLNYPPPYAIPYEWFTVGGRKMSSSKGIGVSAKEVCEILPADVFRFFIVRSPIETALDFNPYGESILNIFDDYDRCLSAYFDKLENNIPKGKPGEVILEYARIIELSQVRMLPSTRLFIPRFRTVVNLVKTKVNLLPFFEKQKGSLMTGNEKEILEERELYAQVYLAKYSAEKHTLSTLHHKEDKHLSDLQKQYLSKLIENLGKAKKNRDDLQKIIFESIKQVNISAKEAFQAFYHAFIQKEFGPKAVDLILDYGIEKTVQKLGNFLQSSVSKKQESTKTYIFSDLKDSSIFSIDTSVKKRFSSITIGIAIIKGVTIGKTEADLKQEIERFVEKHRHLTNEEISAFPEIQSYRQLYKEMGIDWHSRRPSPEALLRRLSQGKGFPYVNSCVDAYNLVVLQNRVSSGAFDFDQIKFPTVLRFPKVGESILLLGDDESTKYTTRELAYFDELGGYNIDFNYRDAQRTAVNEKTKNLLINIDGVYHITRAEVEKTLKETVDAITKCCGGTVKLTGIVDAIS